MTDGFPVMTACGCAAPMEGPRPDCRVHGCPACRDLRTTGHAEGCLYTGPGPDPDDVWITMFIPL